MRWRVISILVTNLLVFQVLGQNLEETKVMAREAYERGDYQLALTSFQRVHFFTRDAASPEVFYYIGECQYRTGSFAKAVTSFDRAYYATDEDSLQQVAVFGKIRSLINQREWDLALAEIYAEEDYLDPEARLRSEFFKGLCFFAREDYDAAEEAFLYVVKEDSSKQRNIRSIFDDEDRLNKPNPNVARILSYVVPGAGQLYVGDVKNSLNSFLLNVGLGVLFVHTAINYTLIDAVVSVVPWFQRYYMGGSSKAEVIAEAKREENRREVLRDVVLVVEQ